MVTYACNSCSGEAKTEDLWGYLASQPCVLVKLQVQRARLNNNKVDDILKNVLWLLHVHAHTYTCAHAIHLYLNMYTHIHTCNKRAISRDLWYNIVSTVTYLCYIQEKTSIK